MKKLITLLLITCGVCLASKTKAQHIVSAPAYHTKHQLPEKITSVPGDPKYRIKDKPDQIVWICADPKAVTYHQQSPCNLLKLCSAEIQEVRQSEARDQLKRHACRKCYP